MIQLRNGGYSGFPRKVLSVYLVLIKLLYMLKDWSLQELGENSFYSIMTVTLFISWKLMI